MNSITGTEYKLVKNLIQGVHILTCNKHSKHVDDSIAEIVNRVISGTTLELSINTQYVESDDENNVNTV